MYSYLLTGIPIPIVAVSAGIAHDQYGINDMWVTKELMANTIKVNML